MPQVVNFRPFVGGRLGDASAKLIKSVTGVSEQSEQRHGSRKTDRGILG